MKTSAKIVSLIILSVVSAVALADRTDMDPNFGVCGVVALGTEDVRSGANGVTIQADGKIVAVGHSSDRKYINRFATIRLNLDGTLDNAFGKNGILLTATGLNGSASALAIQPDGKIVVSGFAVVDETSSGFTLVRYNTNGTLDMTFGKNGIVFPSKGSRTGQASTIAIQRDGKIIVGGSKNVEGFDDFALARYGQDGSPDKSFGNNGLVITSIGKAGDTVSHIAIQPDGKIIAVGTVKEGTKQLFVIARYKSMGQLDESFGENGLTKLSIGGGSSNAKSVILQPEGRIVVIGDSSVNPTERYQYTPVVTLVGLSKNGKLDPIFGTNGIVTTPLGKSTSAAAAAAMQSDGKLVVVGRAVKAVINHAYSHSFLIARYMSDGALDTTFGKGGVVVNEIGTGSAVANALAIQADGGIVSAGYLLRESKTQLLLTRYAPIGGQPPNPSFQPDCAAFRAVR